MRQPGAIVSILTVMIHLASGQTQTDLIQTGNGARAMGMGYAFTAIADDATSIGWNPAGMAQLVLPEATIVLSMRAMLPSLDFTDKYLSESSAPAKVVANPVSFASVVIPLPLRFTNIVVGAAYRTMYDWERSGEYHRVYTNGSVRGEVTDTYLRTGGIRAISPSFAVEFVPEIRVGVTANFLMGTTEYEFRTERTGQMSNPGVTSTKSTTADYSGVGIEIGTLLQPMDWLRVGFRGALPYKRSSVTTVNGLSTNTLLEVPFAFSAGVAFAIAEDERLSLDYRSEPWTKGVLRNEDTNEIMRSPYGDYNIGSFHVGYESVDDVGDHLFAFRMGAYTRPTTSKDAKGEQITGFGISLGLGWSFNFLSFDVAANYINISSYTNAYSEGVYELNVQDNELLLTTSFVFYF